MENNSNYRIWFFVLICIGFFSLNKITNYIEAKQSNDYNSEVYLRKISQKLEELYEQVKPYNENWEYDSIKAKAEEAEFKIYLWLEQIRLYGTGKIRTGLLSSFIPESWLNYEEISFDSCNEVLLKYYAQDKYYLKQELELIKPTLSKRSEMAQWLKEHMIFKIELEMDHIIKKEIADDLISNNNFEIPNNLYYKVRQLFDYSNNKQKIKTIVNEIIKNNWNIESYCASELIRKNFIPNYVS